MKRPAGAPLPRFQLPQGYHFELYQPGDERDWARIETSVLEFDNEMDAFMHFQEQFIPLAPELPRRCIFVARDSGEKVGTATAWWGYTGVRRDPMVHWVAVKPGYQGLGLGKALIGRTVLLLNEIEGDRAYFLHTQTWSHRAVRLYLWAGFHITDEEFITGYPNQNSVEATAILKGIGLKL
jgi:GNAT superfamily N-acetyltransferase